MVPVVTVKFTVVAPAATVTDPGTVSAALVPDRLTSAPPVGAAADSVTVHVDVDVEPKLVGAHCRLETVGRELCVTVIAPPVPETLLRLPSDKTPITLLNGKESRLLLLVEEVVAETTATTPLAMMLVFMPVARQVSDPLAELQFSVLPAAVNTGPATTLSEVMSPIGYESVHCRPAGALVAMFNERFSEMAFPRTTAPEAKLRDEF